MGVGAFFYGGMFAYVAGTPFAYITYHHVSPQLYGLLFAVGIVGIMATNTVNARVVARAGSERLMRAGTTAAALAGLALAVTAWTGWGGLGGLMAPLFVFIGAAGFVIANAIVGALGCSPQRAGAVSALVGAAQYGAGMLGSALVGWFTDGTPWAMGWVIALTMVASVWVNDTMQYVVGSLIGKTPFSRISPNKTLEGTIGGSLICIVAVTAAGYFLVKKELFLLFLIVSAVTAIIGTLGDLLESKIKRMAGVKDSGNIMPGHGGFLDRFDSLILATPFVVAIVTFWLDLSVS